MLYSPHILSVDLLWKQDAPLLTRGCDRIYRCRVPPDEDRKISSHYMGGVLSGGRWFWADDHAG